MRFFHFDHNLRWAYAYEPVRMIEAIFAIDYVTQGAFISIGRWSFTM